MKSALCELPAFAEYWDERSPLNSKSPFYSSYVCSLAFPVSASASVWQSVGSCGTKSFISRRPICRSLFSLWCSTVQSGLLVRPPRFWLKRFYKRRFRQFNPFLTLYIVSHFAVDPVPIYFLLYRLATRKYDKTESLLGYVRRRQMRPSTFGWRGKASYERRGVVQETFRAIDGDLRPSYLLRFGNLRATLTIYLHM